MKTIDGKIKGIIIPSGNLKLNTERYMAALKYNREKCEGNAPFIVSGMGPDTNSALEYSEEYGFQMKENIAKLDFHADLWSNLENYVKFGWGSTIFGVDTNSLTSAENLRFTFPNIQADSGKYAIVSYPLHLLRFRFLEKAMKQFGKLSKNVSLEYVPTKKWFEQTRDEWIYGLAALGKEIVGFSFLKERKFE
jgi:hypothetical protein